MPGMVTVGCKLPHGLHLHLDVMEDTQEPIMGGGWKTVKRASKLDGRVTLRGWAKKGESDPRLIGGCAFTQVDADFWARWIAANQSSELVKSGMVFGHEKRLDAEAQAREVRAERSGFEPVDPDKLPAEFKHQVRTAEKG